MVKSIIMVLLLIAAVPFLMAENSITVDMELYNTVLRTRDTSLNSYWAYTMAGKGAISFKSTGNKNVRADISGDIIYPDSSGIPGFILQKAYIKAKFPIFRLTIGKTRLGYINLTGTELRSETTWLTSVNYPLGRFSFIEGLIVAPPVSAGLGKLQESGAGIRLYTKASGIKIETGYYFDGTDRSSYDITYTETTEALSINAFHRPYISLQGNFGPDWYLNTSLAIPEFYSTIIEFIAKDTFNISFGLFHMMEAGYDNSITLRLESVILPYFNWTEEDGEAGSYAMLIYPEVSLGLGSTISLSIRSIISPIELSAQVTTGFSWNVFEGFSLLTFVTVNAGDGNDTFAWEPSADSVDGISIMTGIKYIY
jgi:hypothetical protein